MLVWIDPAGLTILAASIIDLSLGDAPNRYHPVAWMGMVIGIYTRFWEDKAPAAGRFIRFFFGLISLVSGMALFGLPLLAFAILMPIHNAITIIMAGVLLKQVFSLRRLLEAGKAVEGALVNGNLVEARRLTAWHLVSRETTHLDERHIASAAVESLAENVCDSLIAPLLAFGLGGLPAAWVYRFVNTADAMVGYHNPRYEYFGKSAAILDDILNYVPARLAGMMVCLSAMLTGEDWKNAWRVMLHEHGLTASPNAGWPMSATAGALNVGLEKPANYFLNKTAGLPEAKDIVRARRLVFTAMLLWTAICVLGLWILR